MKNFNIHDLTLSQHCNTHKRVELFDIVFRWLVFCHVPAFCDSLKHYDTTAVFGKTLLRAVFRYVKKLMMDQFHQERDRMSMERRVCIQVDRNKVQGFEIVDWFQVLVLTHFPPFLNHMEEEIYAASSPIWDPEFKHVPVTPHHSHLEAGSSKGSKFSLVLFLLGLFDMNVFFSLF